MAVRLAVVGLGTVGSWLLRELERGAARDVEVVLATSGRDGREGALAETEYDVLAEVVNSPSDGEPGAGLMRDAIARGISVVASDKWPVALHGVELAEAARERGVAFRAESTVMSGTPLLAPLTEALAGSRPTALRGDRERHRQPHAHGHVRGRPLRRGARERPGRTAWPSRIPPPTSTAATRPRRR